MPSLGLVFGRYVEDRNKALLEHRMGLAEYSWLYIVCYFAVLGQPPTTVLEEPARQAIFEDRLYPGMARAIERHIAETGMTTGPWVEELARLREQPARVPFSGNLPPEPAASVEPYRAVLAALACPAAAELDVTITVRRGLIGYDHR